MDLSLQTILYRLLALLVVVGVHGLALAGLWRIFGVRQPQYDGRLTPNPLSHLDLLAVIPFLFCQIGWIRPMPSGTDKPVSASTVFVVALGSLALTLGFAMLLWIARPMIVGMITNVSAAAGFTAAIRIVLEMSTWFVLFNLLPIIPLTMGTVLNQIAKPAAEFLEKYSLWVRLALVGLAFGVASSLRPLFLTVLDFASLGRL